ncbi:MAG: DUF1080 domain-containing protein [Planctomycetota bacterium]|nr:MAG: DUF1080 domain-containing protein [Planctomycetota bacterium]RLT13912.1 MAG: DUF1080 domain-containing protein [Planctomycetota bacterium]
MLGAFSKPADAQDQSAKSAASNLFDGKSLQGWSGLTANWSVQDGAITGENKADAPIGQNTFLVYDKPVKDFELTLEFRIMGGNSGIQYRSKIFDKDKFVVGGYQADIDANKRYMGINYEERGRGILAERGEIVAVDAQGKKSRVGSAGDADALLSQIKWEDWNRYKIVAKGTVLQHYINDQLMSEVQDSEASKAATEGVLALQLHAGPPMKVQFKNIMLKSY